MGVCYLCGNEFNQISTIDHGEHVVQQAIGGNLIIKGILCKNCGGKLSKEIDSPFNSIFQGIATRLNIKTDRNVKNSPSITGEIISEKDAYNMNLRGIQVFWKDFKVTPIKPFHRLSEDRKKVIVYSAKKQFENYKVIVKKEIESMGFENPPEILLCDDIDCSVRYEFPMDNKAFKRGVAKIAIGFACSHGISREHLPLALKISNDNSGCIDGKITLIQYSPLSIIDRVIEIEKTKLANYPAHTLILFTSKQEPSLLFCYIELFSTFQFYILLDDNYDGGDIYRYHYQRIEKASDYIFTPDRRHYKERNIILDGLGITDERIISTYEKQKGKAHAKSLEQIEFEIIKEETEKQKNKVCFESDIKNYVDYCAQILILGNDDSIENKMEFYRNFCLFNKVLVSESGEEKIFDISSYRRFYIEKNKFVDYPLTLGLLKSHSHPNLKKHSFYRFEELECYSQEKSNREKIRMIKKEIANKSKNKNDYD